MKRSLLIGFALLQSSAISFAMNCPDPQTSSLSYGVIPAPWIFNPFSPNDVQSEDNTEFVRANILIAGYGRGVSCTYKISIGEYSIWWPVLTKIPARTDNQWIDNLGGYVCTQGLVDCQFFVAESEFKF